MSFSKYHKGKTVCMCVCVYVYMRVYVFIQPPSFTVCARIDALHIASNKHIFVELKCESING